MAARGKKVIVLFLFYGYICGCTWSPVFKIKVVVLLLRRTHFRSLDCAYSSSHHSDLICLHFRVWQIKTPQMLLKLREGERKRFVFVNGFTSQCTGAVVRTHRVFILPFSE